MNDIIYKQAAIDTINKLYDESNAWLDLAVDALENLPSAQSERKRGKWIPHKEKSREYIGTVLVNVEYDYWLCNACGYRVESGQPMYNFCPNCGIDMRSKQDEWLKEKKK